MLQFFTDSFFKYLSLTNKMKKTLYIFILLFFTIGIANAQSDKNFYKVGGGISYDTKAKTNGFYYYNEYSRVFSKWFSVSLKLYHISSEQKDEFKGFGFRTNIQSGKVSFMNSEYLDNIKGIYNFKDIKPESQDHYIGTLKLNYINENKYTLFKLGLGASFGYFNEKFILSISSGNFNDLYDISIYNIYYNRILDVGLDFGMEYCFKINKKNHIGTDANINYYFNSKYNLLNASLFYRFVF